MIKEIIVNTLCKKGKYYKILTGPSKGKLVNYKCESRSQHIVGLYEREIYKYFKKACKDANTLIDIGANDGYYVLAFLKAQATKIIACEPGPAKEELLDNIELNLNGTYNNVLIENRPIGLEENNYLTFDKLIIGCPEPIFTIVDIDGGEFDLLKSMKNPENFHKIKWIIETHSYQLEKDCLDYLINLGYSVKVIKNAWWRFFIPEKRPLEQNRWLYAEFISQKR